MRRTSGIALHSALLAITLGIAAGPADALVPLEGIASVAAGGYHTCALTTGGGVKCWGFNTNGYLGNPVVTTGSRTTPLDVAGLASGVTAITAGERHVCALTSTGGVKCWGGNSNGQLGDGSTTDRYSPVDVTGLTSGVVVVVAGYSHTCAVTNAGAARCWGSNNNGQLGDGTTTDRLAPVNVTGLASGVAGIAGGGNHTCARTTGGGVKCWGLNTSGQIGDGTLTQRTAPTDVTGLASGVASLAVGRFHSCVVTSTGGAKCWGAGARGQLGNLGTATTVTPVDVSGLTSGVLKIAGGRLFTCALTTSGGAKCFGSAVYGQVGEDYLDQFTPYGVPGLSTGVTDISTGNYHACAVTTAGRVQCWGGNDSSQLGDGVIQQRLVPVYVYGLTTGITKISARGGRSCAIGPSGGVQCWGDNYNGGLGDGSTVNSYFPTDPVSFGTSAISVGGEHSCAINAGGARCWGLNSSGQVGDGTLTTRPSQVSVSGLTSGVAAISAGYYHTCALTTAGGVKCWGRNFQGQLGNGNTTDSSTPVDVTGLTSGVLAISAGGYHSCALTSGNAVKCWGYNLSGQLGNNSTANSLVPVDVSGLANGITRISAGGYHTCALTSGGGIKCWGYNGYGGLGDDTFNNRQAPVDVFGLTANIFDISAGEYHTCAVTAFGGVKCWGNNNSALLGDYSSINRRAPVDVVDLPSGVTAVAAGTMHNCALLTTGGVKCWGFSGEGQVGDGVRANRTQPAEVVTVDLTIVPSISSSQSHALALDADGKVYAWGSDSHGQLGQGRAINRSTPAQITGIPSMSHVSLSQHALAVDIYGQVWSWGENGCGQLGPRAETVTSKPSRVLGATGFTKVAAGGCFSIARKSDGTVWGWGLVPGYGTDTGLRQLAGLAGIVDVAAGTTHALALGAGLVFAFGDNSRGQLGQGVTGPAQAAVQVIGLSAATAIAAGDDASIAIGGAGNIRFWGARSDDSVVPGAAALPTTASTPISISIGKSVVYAALGDGTVVSLPAPFSAWQAVSGFAGATAVEAGVGFQLGIGAGGQLYAHGSNTAGQLGQGSTNTFAGTPTVAGMTNVSMVAVGAINPSVLALKADGTLWFWGADTLGESGDGAAVGSSVPRLVSIPAKVLQVATGDRFSLAFDVNGTVWGWGDNAGAALDGTLVNRSTPASVSAFHVQAIAAGGPAVSLFLRTDATVVRSGTLTGAPTNSGPVAVIGLNNILSIAAGSSAYALRNDNTVLALGGNFSGELGNGTTAASGTPVQVQGITGSVTALSAGVGRAAALTSDGKVWSWGAGPLGNGSAGASSTAVQATSVADAAEVSVGKLATLVRRQNGSLLAWGDTALADAAAVNTLTPYPIAFHEPVKAVRAGANNALGFIVGNTGLAWGFGRYLTLSNTTAAIGDGTYVARDRPVVLLAAGGSGNIDTGDWYFDLAPASAEAVPAASTPKMLGVAQISGSEGGISIDATIKYKSADFGHPVSNFVFGLVPPGFFDLVKRSPALSSKTALAARAAKAGGFVLAQLTPKGWTDVTGQLIAYSQGTANAAGGATNILNGVPSGSLSGARFCIGYGENSGSMLSFNALREVLLLPGASQNTSGVPCILTGVYVDGPPGSRVGTSVEFKASVVGLSPTGQVQFKEGPQALSGPLTIALGNDAVASATVSTSALALGEHSIGASYLGDSQNAPVSSEIPLRHTVVTAATQVNLAGAGSSDQYSTVTFEVTVLGASPTGTVQFKDGGNPFGAPVPLAGGQATLRISTLALGDHTIVASYSGDGGNSAADSAALVHSVVPVFNTRVTLTSSALDSVQGTSITLTATVTGISPTGSVTFRDGANVLGTVGLVNGVATLTLSSLTSGGHQITASYSGDADDQAVTSTAIVQQVAVPAIFSMNPLSLDFGGQLKGATSGARTLTITNAGGAPLTVSSVAAAGPFTQSNNCTTLVGSASCAIQVRFAPAAEGPLNGSVTIQSSLGPQVVALTGTGSASLVTHYYSSILRRAPDAPGQAFWDAEALRMASIGANVNEAWFAMAQFFYFSAEYASFNRNDTDFVTDLYNTFFNRAPDGGGLAFWVANLQQGMPREVLLASFMFSAEFANFTQALYGNTAARAEVDVVMDFYRGLLARLPDPGGFTAWVNNFRGAQCVGTATAVNDMVEAISSGFGGSGEYLGKNRTHAQYVGDLYNSFLRRGGDLGGVQYWINLVSTATLTREQVRQQFIASAEFQGRVGAILAQGCLP